MTDGGIALLILAVIIVLGTIIIPVINRITFRRLPPQQQVRVIMKQAKGLVYFKNVAKGGKGILYYVKNKRKILALPWRLDGGKMVCVRKKPFSHWDYPEEKLPLSEDEVKQLKNELEKYNEKSAVKIIFAVEPNDEEK